MKIVIKVGSHAVLAKEGGVDTKTLRSLVAQIAALQKAGHRVILVSSGAISVGRTLSADRLSRQYGRTIGEKQLLASLGQHELMHIYSKLFKKHAILCSQLLLSKQDFHLRTHYLNIARLFDELLAKSNLIPIVNENDSVAVEALMFTDNDELAGLIASQINADKLIILSNVAGVYDRDPEDEKAALISIIETSKRWPKVSLSKSKFGRGGMVSKLSTAKTMSSLGIITHIASIAEPDVIGRIVSNESIGTTVLPSKKKSNIKRWIAFSPKQHAGEITVNAELAQLLVSDRVLSVLPVGIVGSAGLFRRGDLIKIYGPNKQEIGIGMARFGNDELQGYLHQKSKPVFIHYDYLHVYSKVNYE